jgi:exonuclease VII small subunit
MIFDELTNSFKSQLKQAAGDIAELERALELKRELYHKLQGAIEAMELVEKTQETQAEKTSKRKKDDAELMQAALS